MINPIEIASIVGFVAIVLLIIITVIGLLYSRPKSTVERPRKASLPPLYWGYKPRKDNEGLRVHPNPPKAPQGRGGGSH